MERTLSLSKLEKLLGAVETVAPVSSRLGHNSVLHRHVCRFLSRSMLDCRYRKATLMIASGTAIEPWARRAAELFDVKTLQIAFGKDDPSADYFVPFDRRSPHSRDSVLINMADRVDAVYVRQGGAIANNLVQRLNDRRDVNTRVAIAPESSCAALDLIAAGAIGWFYNAPRQNPDKEAGATLGNENEQWTRTDGQWLIHCTRGPRANWPQETERQYLDSILIGDDESANRRPIDALCRIVRTGRLIAASTATAKTYPVVCFSELSLAELLGRRCYRPQLGRWDYEPYGIAIRRSAAESMGIKSVIYGEPSLRGTLSERQRYRFHPNGKTYDWRVEKEWRASDHVDLAALETSDVRVFAADSLESRRRLAGCDWPVSFITQSDTQCV